MTGVRRFRAFTLDSECYLPQASVFEEKLHRSGERPFPRNPDRASKVDTAVWGNYRRRAVLRTEAAVVSSGLFHTQDSKRYIADVGDPEDQLLRVPGKHSAQGPLRLIDSESFDGVGRCEAEVVKDTPCGQPKAGRQAQTYGPISR